MKFADVWIWTADLWCWKRPLYQLSHNHCPAITGLNEISLRQKIFLRPEQKYSVGFFLTNRFQLVERFVEVIWPLCCCSFFFFSFDQSDFERSSFWDVPMSAKPGKKVATSSDLIWGDFLRRTQRLDNGWILGRIWLFGPKKPEQNNSR